MPENVDSNLHFNSETIMFSILKLISLTCKSKGSGILLSVSKLSSFHISCGATNILTLAGLLNVSGNGIGNELVHDILQVGGGHLPADDVNHLLPDVPHLVHKVSSFPILKNRLKCMFQPNELPVQPVHKRSSLWTSLAFW